MSNFHNFVVIVGRESSTQASDVSAQLKGVPGVEISSESRSFVDIVADEDLVSTEYLQDIVTRLGGELHEKPEAQLMEPIPWNKIP